MTPGETQADASPGQQADWQNSSGHTKAPWSKESEGIIRQFIANS
jgi:hypothetical protein